MKKFPWTGMALLCLFLNLTTACSTAMEDPLQDGFVGSELRTEEEAHAQLDTICKFSGPIYFRSEDGSFTVNKALVPNSGGLVEPCVTTMPWGTMVLYNGYSYAQGDTTHLLKVDFALAPGWVCDLSDWMFTTTGSITGDPNLGHPLVGTDWSSGFHDPMRNEWSIILPVEALPSPCFDLACRLGMVRLRLGDPNENFRTTVWAVNQSWDDVRSEYQSNTEYAVHYCPWSCRDASVPVDSVCQVLYTGAPALAGCVQLSAGQTGEWVTYEWSTGATTETISACPIGSTTYAVTISEGGIPVLIRYFNVHLEDISCGGSSGNNGLHKVWVCHVPPGNPSNPQDICIDWSGVPAHVARFRSPGNNPNQGHDSGCEIGRCGSNPCEQ